MDMAAVSLRRFSTSLTVSQLRSQKTRDFGAGNMTTFKEFVKTALRLGIRSICLLPLHETSKGMASPFSRTSANALSHRLLDLSAVPEIAKNRRLCNELNADLSRAAAVTQQTRTDLALVEVMHDKYLRQAFRRFNMAPDADRQTELAAFCKKHSWWLDKYAYFKVLEETFADIPMEQWDKEYADMDSTKAQDLIRTHRAQIDYFKYVQMEIHRQVTEAFAYAHEQGIEEIEVLVGVGTSRVSAEGFLMQDMFDPLRQIGCFPEPKNGYPTQLWGFLAEKDTLEARANLIEFKTASLKHVQELGADVIGGDHACGEYPGFTTFPFFDPVLLSKGKFRLLQEKDPQDASIAEKDGRWLFNRFGEVAKSEVLEIFGTDESWKPFFRNPEAETLVFDFKDNLDKAIQALPDTEKSRRLLALYQAAYERAATARKAHAKEVLFARLQAMPGIKLVLETNGDLERRTAVQEAIQAAQTAGHDLKLMRLFPYAQTDDRVSLNEYGPNELHILTHDMFHLVFHLTGMMGEARADWKDREKVATLLNKLGILTPYVAGPLSVDSLTTEFMLYIMRQFTGGSTAGTAAFPFSNFYTLLPAYLDAGADKAVNVQPGKPGDVNHQMGNWQQRPANVEELLQAETQIQSVVARAPREIHEPVEINPIIPNNNFHAQVKQAETSVAYQAANGNWTVWQPVAGIRPILEMAVAYTGPEVTEGVEGKAWTTYSMQALGLEIDPDKRYAFRDLTTEIPNTYVFDGKTLLERGLAIGLNTTVNRQHFIIYEYAT